MADGAHITISPSFASTLGELRDAFHGSHVQISADSTLVIGGTGVVKINRMNLSGALVIHTVPGMQYFININKK